MITKGSLGDPNDKNDKQFKQIWSLLLKQGSCYGVLPDLELTM